MARAVVALLLAAWLLGSGALVPGRLFSALADPRQLAGLAAMGASLCVQGLRWWGLLRAQGISLGAGRVLHMFWVSQFFSLVLSASGGEFLRAVHVAGAHPEGKLRGVGSVVIDKAVGLHVMLLLGAAALAPTLLAGEVTSPRGRLGLVAGGLALAATVAVVLLARTQKVASVVRRLAPSFGARLDRVLPEDFALRGLPGAYLSSTLASALMFGAYAVAFGALGATLTLRDLAAVVPMVTLVNSLPISPGGLGAGEATSHLLFLELGVPAGAEAALLVRFWTTLLRLPGGLAYLRGHTSEAPA